MSDLDELDTGAGCEPGDRIGLRDAIADHGEAAIDAMSDWLGDRRLAAFAIRVLERIGRQPEGRAAAVAALAAIDRSELPAHLVDDLDRALTALGNPPGPARRKAAQGGGGVGRSPGRPGLSRRGYWVMRTSPWERPFIWGRSALRAQTRLHDITGYGGDVEQLIGGVVSTGRSPHVDSRRSRRAGHLP